MTAVFRLFHANNCMLGTGVDTTTIECWCRVSPFLFTFRKAFGAHIDNELSGFCPYSLSPMFRSTAAICTPSQKSCSSRVILRNCSRDSSLSALSFSELELSVSVLSEPVPKNTFAGLSESDCASPPTISRSSSDHHYDSSNRTCFAGVIPGRMYLCFFSRNCAFDAAIRTGSWGALHLL